MAVPDDELRTLIDRLAIRDLIDAYARHADRGNAEEQAAVFAEHGSVRLFEGDPAVTEPVRTIAGRNALAATFAELISQYEATTYLNGQSTVTVTGDTAGGETYCLASHLARREGERVLITMAIRYLDRFDRTGEGWRITRRDLVFDWTDTRPSQP